MFIEITHANLKVPVEVTESMIFAVWYSQAQACTMILAAGGAIIPASESPEQIKEKRRKVNEPN